MLNDLRWELIVFIFIGESVDHHCVIIYVPNSLFSLLKGNHYMWVKTVHLRSLPIIILLKKIIIKVF